jgi:hypothetical protein
MDMGHNKVARMAVWEPMLMAGLAGCATGPRYVSYTRSDARCIKDDIASVFAGRHTYLNSSTATPNFLTLS